MEKSVYAREDEKKVKFKLIGLLITTIYNFSYGLSRQTF